MTTVDSETALIHALSVTQIPQHLQIVQAHMTNRLHGTRAIVSLPMAPLLPPVPFPSISMVTFPDGLDRDYILPYFSHPTLYFIQKARLHRIGYRIDYTISLDSNAASYIRSIVEKSSFDGVPQQAAKTIDHILTQNYNFDFLFYAFEQIRQADRAVRVFKKEPVQSPLRFWKKLNRKFRQNLAFAQLFNAIDNKYYQREHKFRYEITLLEATRRAVKFAYEFYVLSSEIRFLAELQRAILLQLIWIIQSQYESKDPPTAKLLAYLHRVHSRGGRYMDRETRLAFDYFKHPDAVPLFSKARRFGDADSLLRRLSNIAWDMTAPRFLEMVITARLQGDFSIPFFLSFDKALCDAFRRYPVKFVMFNEGSIMARPFPETASDAYFQECPEVLTTFFSPESRRERDQRAGQESSPAAVWRRTLRDYRDLRRLLS